MVIILFGGTCKVDMSINSFTVNNIRSLLVNKWLAILCVYLCVHVFAYVCVCVFVCLSVS